MNNENKLLLQVIETNKGAISRLWHLRSDPKWRTRLRRLINNTRTFIICANGGKKIA